MLTRGYQKNKERFSKEAGERFQNLSEEEKNKKRQYPRERYRNLFEEENKKRYKNLLEDEKQRLIEYIKKLSRMQK